MQALTKLEIYTLINLVMASRVSLPLGELIEETELLAIIVKMTDEIKSRNAGN
jgi:hypothetical protein